MKWTRPDQSKCPQGHDMTDPYINPKGHAVCRECKRRARRAWWWRERAKRLAIELEAAKAKAREFAPKDADA